MICPLWLVVNDYRMKVPCQTLNDCLSFITHPSQLRAFNHTMSGMISKLVIYRLIDLRTSSSESKIYLFSFLWIYNDLYLITSHKFISLNFLMKKYFWTPCWLVKLKNTCFLLLLFQSFSNFVFNLIQTQWKAPWFHNEI